MSHKNKSHFGTDSGSNPHPSLTLPMRVSFVFSYFWISKILVSDFNGSPALASSMSTKHGRITSQNITKEKNWKEEKNKRKKKRNRGNNWKRKPTSQICGTENHASFLALNWIRTPVHLLTFIGLTISVDASYCLRLLTFLTNNFFVIGYLAHLLLLCGMLYLRKNDQIRSLNVAI